jgi:hypothetical protein
MQSFNYHKEDGDTNTFVDRQMNKDAKDVAEAFNKKFKVNTNFDVKKIKKNDLDEFIENNFLPIEDGEEYLERFVFILAWLFHFIIIRDWNQSTNFFSINLLNFYIFSFTNQIEKNY